MTQTVVVTSRDNPLLQRIRKLNQGSASYRKLGEIWLEGDHLCSACLIRGLPVAVAVIADSAWIGEGGLAASHDPGAQKLSELASGAAKVVVVPQALWSSFTSLESPARIGFLVSCSALGAGGAGEMEAGLRTVVLDRLQDAGNVGSILRSASALGIQQVVALKGTAALWSQKVLRAGMGAHFALRLIEQVDPSALPQLGVPLVATSSHADFPLHQAPLVDPCAWVMGHEGQGVAASVMTQCEYTVSIPQPGGEESLNVAAAAAVVLYESLRRRL
ncbi:MAG TPA: RNA methyltransferase [Aquabacterium sp.]|nr:RNA methyltransferase [Aquabacterium sp.]